MSGLKISKQFFLEAGLPALKNQFPNIEEKAAFGMVGEGSDCFGYDDEISRDHDWGPGFCIWIESAADDNLNTELREAYGNLPQTWKGFKTRLSGAPARTGVFEISTFFKQFTGMKRLPKTVLDWWGIPDFMLAASTNGEVFSDSPGVFSAAREYLSAMPEDVRVKHIAQYAFKAGQSGQYNYLRAFRRGDTPAQNLALSRFGESAMKMLYHLGRRYPPYYKWLHRGLIDTGEAGKQLSPLFIKLFEKKEVIDIIETISSRLIEEIKNQGLSDGGSDFLIDHLADIHDRISSKELAILKIEP